MFLYFVKKVKRKLGKEGDKKEEGELDKSKKTRLFRSLQLVGFDKKMKIDKLRLYTKIPSWLMIINREI
jgi:hypothetical protein